MTTSRELGRWWARMSYCQYEVYQAAICGRHECPFGIAHIILPHKNPCALIAWGMFIPHQVETRPTRSYTNGLMQTPTPFGYLSTG